jgi:hypothetical protein
MRSSSGKAELRKSGVSDCFGEIVRETRANYTDFALSVEDFS